MENYSNTTNNVSTEFTTTTTNAVEITPAQLEITKLQAELETTRAELEQIKQSLETQTEMQNKSKAAIVESVYTLALNLDAPTLANTICRLNSPQIITIIQHLTDKLVAHVKTGIDLSINADQFKTEIEDLDDYISDKYNEEQILDLIDKKYSWSTLMRLAFRNDSIDTSDVIDYIDTSDVIDEELRKGNIEFSDIMSHFDNSDCFDYLDNQGEMTWYNVKDYVDMDEVKADVEIDTDTITDYISNLDNSEFRTLITNLS